MRKNREKEEAGTRDLLSSGQKRESERGEGVRGIYGAHAGVQNTLRLKLETKTPVWAKPEIST